MQEIIPSKLTNLIIEALPEAKTAEDFNIIKAGIYALQNNSPVKAHSKRSMAWS